MKRNIQLLISEEFAEKTISENDSVRLLDEVIDEIDLTALYLGGSTTIPRTMLKVVIYAADKSHNKIRDNRTGTQLHGELSA